MNEETTTETMTSGTTTPRPTLAALREWGKEHGVPVPARGRVSAATWAKWDEWYTHETAAAARKLRAAYARAEKAFVAATAHVQKHFEN